MEIEKATISTHNGSTFSQEHNRRDIAVVSKESHIRPNGEYEVWRDESVRDAYHRLFDQALQEYNDKQTRADRKIKSYYDHIARDSRKKLAYEMIVGVYQQNCVISDEKKIEILRKFVDTWDERNKVGDNGLELIGCYLHNDEAGGLHIHCDYVGVSSSFKNGLSRQSSLTKALEDIGFTTQGKQTAQIAWEARENQYLGQLCAEQGILVLHPGSEKKQHLDIATYKATMKLEELEQANENLTLEITAKNQELQVLRKDILEANLEKDTIKAQNSIYEVVKDAYSEEHKVEILEKRPQKTNHKGEIKSPESVVITMEDFKYLRDRAKASDFVMKALEDIKRLGKKLMNEVNKTRIFQDLQDKIAEMQFLLRRTEDEKEKM